MNNIWAISWDYGTFSPSKSRSSNTHEQPSSGARCLISDRTLHLLQYFMCVNSQGSGETAWMRRLALAFAGCLCDKYHNLMSMLIWEIFKKTCLQEGKLPWMHLMSNIYNYIRSWLCLDKGQWAIALPVAFVKAMAMTSSFSPKVQGF